MKKSLSLILASVILACAALTSCSEKAADETTADTTPTTANAETAADTETETETEESDRFADVNYGGKTFTVYTSVDTNDATNGDAFIRGTGEYTGEAINDAVYDRNNKVMDLLGINLEFVEANYDMNAATNQIKIQIQAGDTVWQVAANDIRSLASLSSGGFIANIYNNDILDMEKNYWYADSMRDLMFLDGGMYLLVGDYFTDALSSCHTLYANEEIINNVYGDENYVNKMVFDGTWTIDKMTQMVGENYTDTDGDGKKSGGDTYGYACVGMWGSAIPMLISQDIHFVDKTADSVEYAFNNEHSIAVLDKLQALYYSDGTNTTACGDITTLRTFFINKQCLFMGYNRLGDLTRFREVEFPIGVLPYPKYEESQENYVSLISEYAAFCGIPVTNGDTERTGVILENLCAESYNGVREAYNKATLNFKYIRDEDSAEMLNLVFDTGVFNLADALGITTIGDLLKSNASNGNPDIASSYAKVLKPSTKLLDKSIAGMLGE